MSTGLIAAETMLMASGRHQIAIKCVNHQLGVYTVRTQVDNVVASLQGKACGDELGGETQWST